MHRVANVHLCTKFYQNRIIYRSDMAISRYRQTDRHTKYIIYMSDFIELLHRETEQHGDRGHVI